jgi:hypothetical protein
MFAQEVHDGCGESSPKLNIQREKTLFIFLDNAGNTEAEDLCISDSMDLQEYNLQRKLPS